MTAPDLSIPTTIAPAQPEDPAARTARHLRMLAELEELGMQLARATAAKALAELAEPDPPEDQPEASQSGPQTPPPPPQAAQAATPRRTGTKIPCSPRKTDAVTSFIRLAKAVCELIALEAGLAASPAAARFLASPTPRADPRQAQLREAFLLVTTDDREGAPLRCASTARCDEILAADPDQTQTLPDIFFPLCEELGIEPDCSKLSDEIIGIGLCLYGEDDEEEGNGDPDWDPPPRPRATSPP
jgi:hypothetical protein